VLKALLINPKLDDTFSIVDISLGYKELQKLVGGTIEGLLMTDTMFAYINEEGKFLFPEPNLPATHICHALKIGLRTIDCIYGPMVITGPVGEKGEDTSITQETIDKLNEVVCFTGLSKLKI